ncbi:hypothetical protein GCM10027217_44150 [Pseudomaricurvus hydrocarbonicus]
MIIVSGVDVGAGVARSGQLRQLEYNGKAGVTLAGPLKEKRLRMTIEKRQAGSGAR